MVPTPRQEVQEEGEGRCTIGGGLAQEVRLRRSREVEGRKEEGRWEEEDRAGGEVEEEGVDEWKPGWEGGGEEEGWGSRKGEGIAERRVEGGRQEEGWKDRRERRIEEEGGRREEEHCWTSDEDCESESLEEGKVEVRLGNPADEVRTCTCTCFFTCTCT